MNPTWRFSLLFTIAISVSDLNGAQTFSKYDYLHGKLTALRTCYDVKHYGISVKVEPEKKYISGSNSISFLVVEDFTQLQLDFSLDMKINRILFNNLEVSYKRDSNATFVTLNQKVHKGSFQKLIVEFSGYPREAKKAPWDGGFVWSKDSLGIDWVGLACEGNGASLWLPCKDHWSDEADSMDMHLTVPSGLTGVSNGKLISEEPSGDGFRTFNWQVKNPINNYSISINAGNYVLISDQYVPFSDPQADPIPLSYYVLKYNESRARTHFQQVKPMLACFERYFGVYPFRSDSYKLVETPYWGMEHQSCVAYGNHYKNNSYGFDFIIIHESAHEWFANSITASDPADMWIHESFTTYAEALYVECRMGQDASLNYLKEQKLKITNKEPMIGPRDVYYHGHTDNDIYYKGTWILHTMRSIIDNDSVWFSALKGFSIEFEKKIITTRDVISFFNKATNRNWNPFFEQYLYHRQLPQFNYKISINDNGTLVIQYRWKNVKRNFDMPLKVTMTRDKWSVVTPMKSWQLIDLNFFEEDRFRIATDLFLIETKKSGLNKSRSVMDEPALP